VRPVRIAVIGVGPRGLSAVERIVSLSRLGGPPVELFLVEPGELGVGIHRPEQPDYLLLNTICSQLTVFSDRVMVPGAPVTQGPARVAHPVRAPGGSSSPCDRTAIAAASSRRHRLASVAP